MSVLACSKHFILNIKKNVFILGKKCVTESEGFKMVCIGKPVLETALSALNNLRGDLLDDGNDRIKTFYLITLYIIIFLLCL